MHLLPLVCRLLLLVGGLLPLPGICLVAIPSDPGRIPVIQIDVGELTPLEIGLQAGQQAKGLFPDIERRYDTHLAATLNQTAFNGISKNRLPPLLKRLDTAYRQELEGVAGSWSLTRTNQLGDGLLSLDEYLLLNLLPDVGLSPGGSGFGVMGKVSSEKGPIVGRNLDWSSTPELRGLQTITIYQRPERTVVSIGFAGITSVQNGFNDKGLFLGYFDAEPYSPYKQAGKPLEGSYSSSVFGLRKTLETSTSIQQATPRLTKNTYGFSNSILMADKTGIQVLEYPAGGIAKVRQWNSSTLPEKPWNRAQQIAVVGCHVLASLADNCKDVQDSVRWERLRKLAHFDPSQPAGVEDVSSILFDTANDHYEIFNPQTLQSLLYLPASNGLYLYAAPEAGEQPASPFHQPYLDLLPSGQSGQPTHKNGSGNLWGNFLGNIWWGIWLLLLTKVAIVLWIVHVRQARKKKAAIVQ